jgi:NADH-quinone oxidoreductase subunit E
MSLSTETRTRIEALRDRYPQSRSAVLPSLWALQEEVGYLSTDGMVEVARLLDLTPSEVQAVSSFYSMYFDKPSGRHHAIVCVNVSCALRGADDIVAHLEEKLGCRSGETTKDGELTWEQTVECLGACGGAPAMQLDHHFHEDLTIESVDRILDAVRGTAPDHGGAVGAPGTRPHAPASTTPPATTAEGPPADAPAKKRRTSRSKRPQVSDTDL